MDQGMRNDHANRKNFAFLSLAGQHVSVHTVDGCTWEGVFVGVDEKASEAVVLFAAVRTGGQTSQSAVCHEECFIPMESIMSIDAIDIKIQTGVIATEKVAPCQPKAQRPENPNAIQWDEDVMLGDFESEAKNWKAGREWDQFAENEKRFGVRSNYSEELYTTKLNIDLHSAENIKRAERLAREIENSGTSHGIQHRIERGEDVELDEGELYSDVKRVSRPSANRKEQPKIKSVQTQLSSKKETFAVSGPPAPLNTSTDLNPKSEPKAALSTHVLLPQHLIFPTLPSAFCISKRFSISGTLIDSLSSAAEACFVPYTLENNSNINLCNEETSVSLQTNPSRSIRANFLPHEVVMLSPASAPFSWQHDDTSAFDVAAERLSLYGLRSRSGASRPGATSSGYPGNSALGFHNGRGESGIIAGKSNVHVGGGATSLGLNSYHLQPPPSPFPAAQGEGLIQNGGFVRGPSNVNVNNIAPPNYTSRMVRSSESFGEGLPNDANQRKQDASEDSYRGLTGFADNDSYLAERNFRSESFGVPHRGFSEYQEPNVASNYRHPDNGVFERNISNSNENYHGSGQYRGPVPNYSRPLSRDDSHMAGNFENRRFGVGRGGDFNERSGRGRAPQRGRSGGAHMSH